MKKHLYAVVLCCLFSLSTASAALPAQWNPILKDHACANKFYENYDYSLIVQWPGKEVKNYGYKAVNINGNRTLLYVVAVEDINATSTPSDFRLFSYNCNTKKSIELAAGLPSYAYVVSADSQWDLVTLGRKCIWWCGGLATLEFIVVSNLNEMKPVITDINLKELKSLWEYEELLDTYIDALEAEWGMYANKLLSATELWVWPSPKLIINGTATVNDLILQGGYNFTPSIVTQNSKLYLKWSFILGISNNSDVNFFYLPSIIAPINIENKSIDLSKIEYSLWSKEIKRLNEQWITKYDSIASFGTEASFTREQAAKFFSAFAINVLKKTPDTNLECKFTDINYADKTLQADIITSCQLGIFQWSKWSFDPKREISAEEVVAVLIRAAYGKQSETMKPRYTDYIAKAQWEWLLPTIGFEINKPLSRWIIGQMLYKAGNK